MDSVHCLLKASRCVLLLFSSDMWLNTLPDDHLCSGLKFLYLGTNLRLCKFTLKLPLWLPWSAICISLFFRPAELVIIWWSSLWAVIGGACILWEKNSNKISRKLWNTPKPQALLSHTVTLRLTWIWANNLFAMQIMFTYGHSDQWPINDISLC